MREVPTLTSSNSDIEVVSVDYRHGFFSRGDWYVTWGHRHRPREQRVMRLPLSQLSGRSTLCGEDFEYRIHWRLESVPGDAARLDISTAG